MRKLALLAFLLMASPCWGAWSIGDWTCNATEEPGTPDNSMSCSGTGTVNTNNWVICRMGIDNTGTTDGSTSEITSITGATITFSFIAAFRNGQAAAAGGAQVELWVGKYTGAGENLGLTLTTANNITDKTMQCEEFAVGSGNTVSLAGTAQTEAVDNGDAANLTISGLTSQEYLFMRAIATESNNATSMTATASYTLLPTDGCTNTGTGGEATDMGICTEYRILSGTGDSSNPALADTTNDNASIYVALLEAAPPASDAPEQIIVSKNLAVDRTENTQ